MADDFNVNPVVPNPLTFVYTPPSTPSTVKPTNTTEVQAVVSANPAVIISGQYVMTVSASAISPAQAIVNGLVVKSLATNTGKIYVGPAGVSAATGYLLMPGEAISYATASASDIYAIGTVAGDVLHFTGN